MKGYCDIETLADLPAQRCLVTSGFKRLQDSKIKSLRLEPFFSSTYVDAIDYPNRVGKLGLFARILRDYELAPSEVLVVGDNADSEIKAGIQRRIQTVQTLRPGVPKAANATFYVHSLGELKELLDR